ncbi:MAG TPA: hypothetical protein DCP98_06040, partial [Sphaerochaeta sp.]|nr:hypothetical protein [Sphaerochaeta sp.]
MNNEGRKIWFHILNIVLIVASLFALVFVYIYNTNLDGRQFNDKESSVVLIEDGWTKLNEDGTFSDFHEFGKKLDLDSIVLSRIFVFDQNEFIRDTLSFFSSYCAVEVYQDGALIYAFSSQEDIDNRILPGLFSVNAVLDVLPGEASEVSIRLSSYLGITVNPI